MDAERVLRSHAVHTPHRVARLMREGTASLALDLRGLRVVTELGTGVYALTPALAALGGAAKVTAIAQDSEWGTVGEASQTLRAACDILGLSGSPIDIVTSRAAMAIPDADIVTNLGFVRPINHELLQCMKPTAVVPLMCESWEVRPQDVDVRACRELGILVAGTNERHPSCDVFRFAGPLAGRMILDAGLELLDTTIVVLGSDDFAPVIENWLNSAGSKATVVSSSRSLRTADLADTDVLMVAEYASEALMVGPGGAVDPALLASASPGLTVIQFAGRIDGESLLHHGVRFWPDPLVPPRRMSRTFSYLGPAPVLQLHAAGLKVGELLARASLAGHAPVQARSSWGRFADLPQLP